MAQKFNVIMTVCLLMLVVHAVNHFSGGALSQFGIRPGDTGALPYIFSAPWLHGSWGHLFNNLVGMSIFSFLCLLRGVPFYLKSSAIIIVVTGVLVWLFARQAIHIGASGWVFGLWSLAMALAWFQRSFMNIAIALFVAFFYGGMVFGVLPGDRFISFESHLFGAFSGILAAYVLTRNKQK